MSRAVPCGGTHCSALLQLALLDSSGAARLSANWSPFACCVWREASRNFQMLSTSPLLHEASLPLHRGIPLSVHALDTSQNDDPRCHTEDNLSSRLSVVPLDTTLVPRRRICQCGAPVLATTHMVPSLSPTALSDNSFSAWSPDEDVCKVVPDPALLVSIYAPATYIKQSSSTGQLDKQENERAMTGSTLGRVRIGRNGRWCATAADCA